MRGRHPASAWRAAHRIAPSPAGKSPTTTSCAACAAAASLEAARRNRHADVIARVAAFDRVDRVEHRDVHHRVGARQRDARRVRHGRFHERIPFDDDFAIARDRRVESAPAAHSAAIDFLTMILLPGVWMRRAERLRARRGSGRGSGRGILRLVATPGAIEALVVRQVTGFSRRNRQCDRRPFGNDTIRADDDPPVCQRRICPGSRLRQLEQRKRAPAGSGRKSTSRCALWPHRRHSMKIVFAPRAMRELYDALAPSQQTRLRGTVCALI